MKIQSIYLSHLIDELQQQGQYSFTKNQLLEKLSSVSSHALARRIKRLAEKKRITPLGSGFYVIVPIEYQSSGAPPANWFVDAFMKHMKQPYYVSLLTAASLYGAAHQQAQEFQIMVTKPARSITVGRSQIHFYVRKHLISMITRPVKVFTGQMQVGIPEVVAFDMVKYPAASGYWNNILTVLEELHEQLSVEVLVDIAKRNNSIKLSQRLGYLLEKANAKTALIDALQKWVSSQHPRYTFLDTLAEKLTEKKNNAWKLYVNVEIESDL